MPDFEKYAEVIVPLPFNATFTYRVPHEMHQTVQPGHRVIVQFGARKYYTGIVTGMSTSPPTGIAVKDIAVALDSSPIIRHPQMRLWQWIADYYMCSVGDVYKAALPSGLKIESETRVQANEDFDKESLENQSVDNANTPTVALSEREKIVLDTVLTKGSITPQLITKETGLKNTGDIVNRLIEKGVLRVSEQLSQRYRPKHIDMVRAAFQPDSESVAEAFKKVKGAPKQEKMLLTLIQLSGANRVGATQHEVTKENLLEKSGATSTILRELVKKGVAEIYVKEISRFKYTGGAETKPLPHLSEAQNKALDQIHKSFFDHDVTLLHGVTSSGKTEVYMHLIDYVIKQDKQVLMLVPEIALTTQLTDRLQRVFGDKVLIYHSRFSDSERVDIWRRMLNDNDRARVIIGARSAVFLPFRKLGLVIVDEEHETSYKQQDPAPRYNGRDTAIMLARMHGAKTLLGSATPTIETYYKAKEGKYGLVSLTERFNGATLPKIEVVDMSIERRKRTLNGLFSVTATQKIQQAIKSGHQAIVFQNRRGYAPYAECRNCAYVPKCTQCDVSLTYHRSTNTLECHYCGATYSMPTICPVCKEPSIELLGYGTERLEDNMAELFPKAEILRMDLDTTRNKDAHAAIIDKFSAGNADILVGTQMVTKGLDFGGVSVVAILNADAMINQADFRASERAFNMLEQVAGRAGRRAATQSTDTQESNEDAQQGGLVIIQSTNTSSPVITDVVRHDYQSHYHRCLAERSLFCYPPFSRVVNIYLRHADDNTLQHLADEYAAMLRRQLGNRVLGPDKPAVSRVQALHIRKIMLKIELAASPRRVKEIITDIRNAICSRPDARALLVHCDVDPV